MEPSSVEDGNMPFIMRVSGSRRWLQWSRPQLRTETRSSGCGVAPCGCASMEPSSVEDGNLRQRQVATQAVVVLQWSRPQLRTETSEPTKNRGERRRALQWSRPQLRTETSRH